MSLEIYIGRNKSGKTTQLNKIKNEMESDKKNVLYIPSEINLRNYVEKEKFGTSKSDPDTPQTIVIKFINEMFSIAKNPKYTKKEKETMKNNIAKFNEMKKMFADNAGNDIFFDNTIVESLFVMQDDKIPNYATIEKEKIISFKTVKKWDEYTSSGSVNYSLLKLLVEFITWIDKNKNKFNLNNFIFIIDEIEKFSHPELIQKTADEILKISKFIDVKISTHSPQLIERILNQSKNDRNGKNTIIFKYVHRDIIVNNEDESKINKINLLDTSKRTNYRELNTIVKCLFSTNVILVEGIADQEFLESLRYEYFNEKYVTIIDCNDRSGVEKIFNFLKELDLLELVKTLLFYDQDVIKGKNNKWDEPKESIKCDGAESIVQIPDFERYFFKYKEINNPKNNKKPNYQFETKTTNSNSIEWMSKSKLNENCLTYENIISLSTKEKIDKKITKIGEKIRKWIDENE